jgi:glucose-6-phosphate dehydrogenase assembly protein OpcA
VSNQDRLASFEKGDSIEVPVMRIEQELAALWREAATNAGQGKAVTRACLWNLIVRPDPSRFEAAKKLVDEIAASVPTRSIVLAVEPGPGEEEAPIRAFVEANWRKTPHGMSGSDEVTLVAKGQAAARLPALVRSLVVTDAPTAMLWWGPAPAVDAPVRALLREVDRLIVDTRKLSSEEGMVDYARLASELPELELVDLSWVGVRPLRGLCAGLFDVPGEAEKLWRLDHVRVSSGVAGTQSRALLAIGWLASRLGWGPLRKDPPEGGTRRFHAERKDGGTVRIELETRQGGPNHGVVALHLRAGDDEWRLQRDEGCISVDGPGLPPRLQPIRKHSDSELAVYGLGPRGRDPVYRDALAVVARLFASS